MRALVIDLNNFSRYPTLPVGQLVASLRTAGLDVDVLSPFARGVQGYPRLTRAKPWGLLNDRLRRGMDGIGARGHSPGSRVIER